MKKKTSDELTNEQKAELATLAAMSDEDINTHDIPEQKDWAGAQRGLFLRSAKIGKSGDVRG